MSALPSPFAVPRPPADGPSPFVPAPAPAEPEPAAWFFSVQAAPDPGVMPRVLELFAKRALVPHRLHGSVSGTVLAVEVQVAGLTRDQAEHAAACLRNILGVERVLSSALPDSRFSPA